MNPLQIGSRREVCWDEALIERADGVHFEEKGILVDDGAYDSLNICFWDEITQQYYLFYRGVHGEGTVDVKWAKGAGDAKHTTVVRDIRMRTSNVIKLSSKHA